MRQQACYAGRELQEGQVVCPDSVFFWAIATAFSWALGCVVHTTASRVVGIPAVMLIRQPLASVVLGIFCLVMGNLWLPSLHLFWLAAASGVFGIVVGDACQYAGALTIGLRPAQVCQSLSSCFTALLAPSI